MRFNFSALLVFLLFGATILVTLQFPANADPIVRALIWSAIAAMSTVGVILTVVKGGARGKDAVLPGRLRRWMLGESSSR
jgi:hypothetical protein